MVLVPRIATQQEPGEKTDIKRKFFSNDDGMIAKKFKCRD